MDNLRLCDYDPTWPEQYVRERARLLGALGYLTDGGVIFGDLEPVGSTAVPGLPARPCLDIAVDAEVPLAQDAAAALAELGYEGRGEGFGGAQLFERSGENAARLYVMNPPEMPAWAGMLTLRERLRQDAELRGRYARLKRETAHDRVAYGEAKAAFLREQTAAALRWHIGRNGFKPLEALAGEFADLAIPWFIASGWALDLFLGEPTRYHNDLDVVIWYEDASELQRYLLARDWTLHRTRDDVYGPWVPGEILEPPLHQVHARRGSAFLDILLSSRQAGHWLYRRDPSIRLPLELVARRHQGLPYLAPEAMLLYKSMTGSVGPRSKDQRDFERVLPHLSPQAKSWLRQAVVKGRPDHAWSALLV